MLPIRIGAQAKNVGQRLLMSQEIRLLTHPAQQIQRHHLAGSNQASQQGVRLLQRGRTGSGRALPMQASTKEGAGAGNCARRGR